MTSIGVKLEVKEEGDHNRRLYLLSTICLILWLMKLNKYIKKTIEIVIYFG